MMTVTKIEPLSKTRYKVYLDGQFAFTLYKGELSRYHIAEESVIEDDIYDSLRLIVIKRAKLRAMHLLSDMGRTESQLRTKLKQGGYAEDAVEAAIWYVKSFGYIIWNMQGVLLIAGKIGKVKKNFMRHFCKKGFRQKL